MTPAAIGVFSRSAVNLLPPILPWVPTFNRCLRVAVFFWAATACGLQFFPRSTRARPGGSPCSQLPRRDLTRPSTTRPARTRPNTATPPDIPGTAASSWRPRTREPAPRQRRHAAGNELSNRWQEPRGELCNRPCYRRLPLINAAFTNSLPMWQGIRFPSRLTVRRHRLWPGSQSPSGTRAYRPSSA